MKTPYCKHPDELCHLRAFQYYENHYWPPDLDSDDVIYDQYGWNRVFTGEVVYLLFGSIGHLFNILNLHPDRLYYLYRLLNVALLPFILSILFFTRSRSFNFEILALIFSILPQFIYIFSYANSDAFGMVVSLLFFVSATKMAEKSPIFWTFPRMAVTAVLFALVIISKAHYYFALVIPGLILFYRFGFYVFKTRFDLRPEFYRHLAFAFALLFIVGSPSRIIYPRSQGDFEKAIAQMRTKRSLPGLGYAGNNLLEHPEYRGMNWFQITLKLKWYSKTFKSFYGCFGIMDFWLDNWIYRSVGIIFSIFFLITIYHCFRFYDLLPNNTILALLLSPGILAVNIVLSALISVYLNFQPQGRYIFGSIIPFALLIGGTIPWEKKYFVFIRTVAFIILGALCIYSLSQLITTDIPHQEFVPTVLQMKTPS